MGEDLRLLTSNRKSLEARYLAIKGENEKFQDTSPAGQLVVCQEKGGTSRRRSIFNWLSLYLLSQLIATLEIHGSSNCRDRPSRAF